MLTLQKYSGPGSRHTCPACGRKRKFVRYIDIETGRYVADHVGRCDRETSCGYHLKPREYFAETEGWRPDISWKGRRRENATRADYAQKNRPRKADLIDDRYLIASLRNYEQNSLVQFLLSLMPVETVMSAVSEYAIGTGRNGETIFWQIDRKCRIRTGKLIVYDRETGKRRKDRSPNWIHSVLKQAGLLPDAFQLEQCFFGEHLLSKYPGRAIAVVEAEKSAVIGSICTGQLPRLVWLACGGKSNLDANRLERLGRDRQIILFPDADGFGKWSEIAHYASKRGLMVRVSGLIEQHATDEDKANGCDIADFLIREYVERKTP